MFVEVKAQLTHPFNKIFILYKIYKLVNKSQAFDYSIKF